MRHILFILGAFFILNQSGFGFDGHRKGFTLGLGFGYSPTTRVSLDQLDLAPADDSFVFDFSIGWAFGRDLFVYEVSIYQIPHGLESESSCCNDVGIGEAQGRWYHYFGDEGWTFFSCVGAGRTFTSAYSNFLTGDGLGFVVGGGYEFFKQIQVGAYYQGGYSKGNGFTYGTRSLQLVLHITAY